MNKRVAILLLIIMLVLTGCAKTEQPAPSVQFYDKWERSSVNFIHDGKLYNVPLITADDNLYYDFNNTVVSSNGYSATLVPTPFTKSKEWTNPILSVYYKTDSSKTSIVNSYGSYYILHEMPKLSKKDAEELADDLFYSIASYEYPIKIDLDYLPRYVADEIEQVCYDKSNLRLSLSVAR